MASKRCCLISAFDSFFTLLLILSFTVDFFFPGAGKSSRRVGAFNCGFKVGVLIFQFFS
jgi:hypothetical protein